MRGNARYGKSIRNKAPTDRSALTESQFEASVSRVPRVVIEETEIGAFPISFHVRSWQRNLQLPATAQPSLSGTPASSGSELWVLSVRVCSVPLHTANAAGWLVRETKPAFQVSRVSRPRAVSQWHVSARTLRVLSTLKKRVAVCEVSEVACKLLQPQGTGLVLRAPPVPRCDKSSCYFRGR